MQEAACNLASCFLCKGCLPEWREVIALKKKTYSVKKGKSIFKEGDTVTGIYFLYSGAAKVHKHWTDQKELILRFATAGDVLGHRGLGGNHVYPIGATALADSKVCFITNDFLEATLRANPSFTYELMHLYMTELQKAEKRMRDLAHMDVKGRIANALLEMAAIFGTNEEGYIAATITRQDIASYAGTTYETVFKFMTELTQQKIITTHGKSIRIHNSDALHQLVV